MKSALIVLERRSDFIDDHIIGVFTTPRMAKLAANVRGRSKSIPFKVYFDPEIKTMALRRQLADGTKQIIRRFALNKTQ